MTETNQKQELVTISGVQSNPLSVINSENFPISVKEGIDTVMEIVNNNTTLPELYGKELQEVPISTSLFLDQCIQMEDHHTPHRKLKQTLIELETKLGALDGAKNSHKKGIVKIERLKNDITELQDIYIILTKSEHESKPSLDINTALRLSSINYQVSEGESVITHSLISDSIITILTSIPSDISDSKILNNITNKIKAATASKMIDLEEAERSLRSNEHLIKDAALKCAYIQKQADRYKKVVEDSGLSYEMAEIIYYTRFFSSDVLKQLRTGDHQIDRGTFGAINQLPEAINKRLLKNVHWLETKVKEDYQKTGSWYGEDYIKTCKNILDPVITGTDEIEGMNITELLGLEPIKIITEVEQPIGETGI